MSVEIIPYRADDVIGMPIRDQEYDQIAEIVNTEEYLRTLERIGTGYTCKVYGKAIGAIVFIPLRWPGTAEVVALFSPDVEKHRRMIHRICKKLVEDVQSSKGFRRIEARIDIAKERNIWWAESMGFECEGRVRAFGPNGEDYLQYSRVRRQA